jgi:hypothetical protein
MGQLQHHYGNPLFPYFNQLFRSPWGLPESYRDPEYLLGPAWKRVVYPFVFSFDSRQASEIDFRDFRILAIFVLVPLVALLGLFRRIKGRCPLSTFFLHGPAIYLLLFATISYALWVQMFAIYRYIVPLEMLAPLLVVAGVDLIPGPARTRLMAAVGIVLLLVGTTSAGNWIRVPFTDKAVEVSHPAINDPAHTIVILAGHEPLSFLLPSFPSQVRFLRIDSTFTNPDQKGVLFTPLMQGIIDRHQGTFLALYIPSERHDVVKRLGDYGLELMVEGCGIVTSPIGAAPYDLCPVKRRQANSVSPMGKS